MEPQIIRVTIKCHSANKETNFSLNAIAITMTTKIGTAAANAFKATATTTIAMTTTIIAMAVALLRTTLEKLMIQMYCAIFRAIITFGAIAQGTVLELAEAIITVTTTETIMLSKINIIISATMDTICNHINNTHQMTRSTTIISNHLNVDHHQTTIISKTFTTTALFLNIIFDHLQ